MFHPTAFVFVPGMANCSLYYWIWDQVATLQRNRHFYLPSLVFPFLFFSFLFFSFFCFAIEIAPSKTRKAQGKAKCKKKSKQKCKKKTPSWIGLESALDPLLIRSWSAPDPLFFLPRGGSFYPLSATVAKKKEKDRPYRVTAIVFFFPLFAPFHLLPPLPLLHHHHLLLLFLLCGRPPLSHLLAACWFCLFCFFFFTGSIDNQKTNCIDSGLSIL